MAFCTSCGAPVEGAFCTKCGTHVGVPGASSAQAEQSLIMLMAEDSNSQRNAHVTVANSEEGTIINLVFETKK
jgi:hypothetical protein